MIDFPKIKGLKWLSESNLDLIVVKCRLENAAMAELDIPGLEIPQTEVDYYLDLSRLAGIRDWFDKGSEVPSEVECLVDFGGVPQCVLYINKNELLKAWMFYKSNKK